MGLTQAGRLAVAAIVQDPRSDKYQRWTAEAENKFTLRVFEMFCTLV